MREGFLLQGCIDKPKAAGTDCNRRRLTASQREKETKATSALSKKLSAPNYILQKGKAGPLKSVTKCLGATAEPFLLHCQAFSPLKEPFEPTELLLCVVEAEKAWVFSATVSRLPS